VAQGEARYRLVLDQSNFQKGVEDAQRQWEGFVSKLEGGAAIGLGFELATKAAEGLLDVVHDVPAAMVEGVKAVAELADKLDVMAAKTGFSAEALQQLDFAAKLNQSSVETLVPLIGKMERSIDSGSKAFGRLGLSVEELKRLAPEVAFDEIAEKIRQIPGATEQAGIAMQIFGRSGAEALPIIKAGLGDARLEATNLGTVLSEETVRAAAELKREGEKLDLAWQGVRNQFFGMIAENPELLDALRGVVKAVGAIAATIRDNKDSFGELATWFDRIFTSISSGYGQMSGFVKLLGETAKLTGTMLETGPAVKTSMFGPREAPSLPGLSMIRAVDILGDQVKLDTAARKAGESMARHLAEGFREGAKDFHSMLAPGGSEFLSGSMLSPLPTSVTTPNVGAQNLSLIGAMDAWDAKYGKVNEEAAKLKQKQADLVKYSADWVTQLQIIAQLSQTIGGNLGHAFASIAGGVSGIGSILQQAGKGDASKGLGNIGGQLSGKGGVGGFLSGVGSVAGIAGAAFSIGSAIVGLFHHPAWQKAQKEAAKILGHDVPEDMAKAILEESKKTHKSVQEVAKKYQLEELRQQETARRSTLEQGLQMAQQGAQTLMGLMDKLSEPAQAAGNLMIKAVQDALAKSGMGFMATGALAKNEAFGAAQSGAGAMAQLMAGMRGAGMVDTGLMAVAGAGVGALKDQAVQAALASGMSQAEAEKAGMAAIGPLLREQMNSAAASGKQLDANTKALLDEAKKNGIEILADPAYQQLDELKGIRAAVEGGAKNNVIPFPTTYQGDRGDNFTSAGGFGPKLLQHDTVFQAHKGEHVMILPRGRVVKFRSALMGFNESYTPEDRPRGTGGTTSSTGTTSTTSTTSSTELAAILAESILPKLIQTVSHAAPVNAPITIAPQINENPLRAKETKEEMRLFTIAGIEKAIANEQGTLAQTIRRAVGKRG